MHGQLIRSPLTSNVLRNNALEDPTTRDVLVYVPPGDGPFPVVMMLPGFAANHLSMVGFNPWKENTIEAFDSQIARGESKKAIIVMPDCMTRWGGSQFVDSAATGRYQTYLADEVIPHVDEHFNTLKHREARGVVGRSSGGFGALRLGMDRPDVVSVIGSHAGDADFDVTMRPMLTNAATAIAKEGSVAAFAERVIDGGPKGAAEFEAVLVIANSAAYAPNQSNTLPYADLPMSIENGRVRQDAWDKWLSHDPIHRITSCRDALKEMALVFIDAGNRDEHGLHFAARELAKEISGIAPQVIHEEFDGGHRGTSFRYLRSLPLIIDNLSPHT